MSKDIWFISDTHFGHENILNIEVDGNKLRPFKHLIEMHCEMITRWNGVVKPNDRVYHLGDFSMHPKWVKIASELNGNKILIKGNHDVAEVSEYVQWFEDIRGAHELQQHKLILTHIPIHPDEFEWWGKEGQRWIGNVHGHLHNKTAGDPRYLNVSVEQINYTPIHLDEVLKYFKDIK